MTIPRLVFVFSVGLLAMATPALALLFMPGRCGTACMSEMVRWSNWSAWISLAQIPVFLLLAYGLGRFVERGVLQVGYARKLLAVTLYFTPLWIGLFSPLAGYSRYGDEINFADRGNRLVVGSVITSTLALLVCLAVLTHPIRSRLRIVQTIFACIDRPEDRPHTLAWLSTSVIATAGLIIAWLMTSPKMWPFVLVALFIAGVGDALAEPVGLRFGRHVYRVRALWTDRIYQRTLEGSACVFVSGVIGVLLFLPWSMLTVLALLLVPAAATLAEAKSPHTWDQPFIIAACWGASLLVTFAA